MLFRVGPTALVAMDIYICKNRQYRGPYTLEGITARLASGELLVTDLAWQIGLDA
jgi:hypothetical protein